MTAKLYSSTMVNDRKRKVEADVNSRGLSAFALRKRLLGSHFSRFSTSAAASGNDDTVCSPVKEDKSGVVAVKESVSSLVETVNTKLQVTQNTPTKTRNFPAERLPEKDGENVSTPSVDPAPDVVTQPQPLPALGQAPPSSSDMHSTFKPSQLNFHQTSHGCQVLRLAEGESLVILGSYGIRVKEGKVKVVGATLRLGERIHWVHAPSCHALPIIRASDNAVVEILPHRLAPSLRNLGAISPMFAKLWHDSSPSALTDSDCVPVLNTFRIIYGIEDEPKRTPLRHLVAPAEWNKKIAEIAASSQSQVPVVLVCGPKSSGKSTFTKMLANRLTTQEQRPMAQPSSVSFLDIDPGQPEFSPPGLISCLSLAEPVLSPSFCHPLQPGWREGLTKCHAYGSLSPVVDPQRYMDSVLDLVMHVRTNALNAPIVINTPGWIQGTGLDILTELIEQILPTDVIYLSQNGPAETVEGLETSCRGTTFSILPSQPSEASLKTAAYLRAMQAQSYFHLDLSTEQDGGFAWRPISVAEMAPWRVKFKGPNRGILGIMFYDAQPPLDLVADAINGTVLALVQVKNESALMGSYISEETLPANDYLDDSTDRHILLRTCQQKWLGNTPDGLPVIHNFYSGGLDPKNSHALGLVLLRGIDSDNGFLHVLTPIPDDVLNSLNTHGDRLVLVSGKLDYPTWAYTEDLYAKSTAASVAAEVGSRVGREKHDEEDTPIFNWSDHSCHPWIEALFRNEKRGVGSDVWRVRRDLGR